MKKLCLLFFFALALHAQTNTVFCADTSGSSTAYACASPQPNVASLSGLLLQFVPPTTNTGAATINVASMGAVSAKQSDCSSALAAGSLLGGHLYLFSFNGTVFCQSSSAASSGSNGIGTCASYVIAASGGNLTVNGSTVAALAGATTQTIPLFTLPAGNVIFVGPTLHPTAQFTGTSITGVTLSIGWPQSATAYAPAMDVYGIAPQTVTAATNASPSVLTAPANSFNTGDVVNVQSATGNTAINVLGIVQVIDANTFSLINFTGLPVNGNGTYTASSATVTRVVQQSSGGSYAVSYAASPVNAYFTSTGANLSALTSGSVAVGFCYVSVVP
jgi:hypothetical protein